VPACTTGEDEDDEEEDEEEEEEEDEAGAAPSELSTGMPVAGSRPCSLRRAACALLSSSTASLMIWGGG
jgi:hypothetical protein